LARGFGFDCTCLTRDVGRGRRSRAASRLCPASRVSSARRDAACISMESFILGTTDAAPKCWVGTRYRIRVTRAPLSLPGRTVIFDFGEVISLTPSDADRAAIARLAEVDDSGAEKFWQAYSAHRDGLDQGTAGAIAYWQAISDDLGTAWDEARMHELWAADFRSWLSINPAVIEVLSDLRAGATRLALLSNAGPDYGSYFRHGPLGDFFQGCYVSGELGLIKPDPEIFLHVLADLSITPAEAIFIDNRDSNVAGAQALGITGHVFTTADALRSFLTSMAPSTD
jgi:putative hydrolase of the HAD superfamily